MSNIRFRLDLAGTRKRILKGDEMKGVLLGAAEQLAAEAGDGYKAVVREMGTRYIAVVVPASKRAFDDNEKNKTLGSLR